MVYRGGSNEMFCNNNRALLGRMLRSVQLFLRVSVWPGTRPTFQIQEETGRMRSIVRSTNNVKYLYTSGTAPKNGEKKEKPLPQVAQVELTF